VLEHKVLQVPKVLLELGRREHREYREYKAYKVKWDQVSRVPRE
jgi:hypothetical protein